MPEAMAIFYLLLLVQPALPFVRPAPTRQTDFEGQVLSGKVAPILKNKRQEHCQCIVRSLGRGRC